MYHKAVRGAMETGRDEGVMGRGWRVSRDDETMGPEGSNYERMNLWGRGREKGEGGGTYDGKRLSDPAIFFN